MRAETVIAWGALVIACLAAGVTLRWVADNDEPMPCAANEVYVWTDYPDNAKCVRSTDHASHQGEDHG